MCREQQKMHLEQTVKQSVMMNESRVDDMGWRQR